MSERTLTRSDLVQAVVHEIGLAKTESGELVKATLELIADALSTGGPAKIVDFGAFHVRLTPERRGRNPKSGEEHIIPSRRVVVFKAARALKERVALGERAKPQTER